jgi:hypothetical protein
MCLAFFLWLLQRSIIEVLHWTVLGLPGWELPAPSCCCVSVDTRLAQSIGLAWNLARLLGHQEWWNQQLVHMYAGAGRLRSAAF